MRRLFARSFDAPLASSSSMLGAGAIDEHDPSLADAFAPSAVGFSGFVVGFLGMTLVSQPSINALKDKISATNKKYQGKS